MDILELGLESLELLILALQSWLPLEKMTYDWCNCGNSQLSFVLSSSPTFVFKLWLKRIRVSKGQMPLSAGFEKIFGVHDQRCSQPNEVSRRVKWYSAWSWKTAVLNAQQLSMIGKIKGFHECYYCTILLKWNWRLLKNDSNDIEVS